MIKYHNKIKTPTYQIPPAILFFADYNRKEKNIMNNKETTEQHRFFYNKYLYTDKTLQVLVQYLLAHPHYWESESMNDCNTDEEVIKAEPMDGRNQYFNRLPLKCKLYLIITLIDGISNPEIMPQGIDNSLYLTFDHLCGGIEADVEAEIDSEIEADKKDVKLCRIVREYIIKCNRILKSEDIHPNNSISLLDITFYKKRNFPKDKPSELENWQDEVESLQGDLFGGYMAGEFTAYKENVVEIVKEQKNINQLCSQYTLLELAKKFHEVISEYANVEPEEIKDIVQSKLYR